MRNLLLLGTTVLLAAACATTSGAKGSSGASGAFPGESEVDQRIKAVSDAGKAALDCLRVKPGEQAPKGGVFEVTAAPDGKLSARPIKWDGPEPVEQCILQKASATTLPPLAGTPVSTLWSFADPNAPPPPPPPTDSSAIATKVQSLQADLGNEVVGGCAQQNLAPDQPADIVVTFYAMPGGKVIAATVTKSTAKDGGFDSCVLEAVKKARFPETGYDGPFPTSMRFHAGRLEKL